MINSDYEIIDAIINDNIQIFEDYEINIRVRMEDTDFSCKISDLEKLFRLIVDNAITECLNFDSTYIRNIIIKSKQFGDQIAFSIIYSSLSEMNPFDEIPKFKDIIEICENNHLLYSYEYNSDNKTANISILFDKDKGDV